VNLAYTRIIFTLILLFAIGGGMIVLQVFLSRKESKWLGLILPMITFGISVLAVLSVIALSVFTATSTLMVDGEVMEQTVTQIGNVSSIIGTAIYIFLLANIPTAVLLAIYAACRGKRNRQRALAKMSVQDLE